MCDPVNGFAPGRAWNFGIMFIKTIRIDRLDVYVFPHTLFITKVLLTTENGTSQKVNKYIYIILERGFPVFTRRLKTIFFSFFDSLPRPAHNPV